MTRREGAAGGPGHDAVAAVRRRATIIFSGFAAVLGAASVAITLANGGGPLQARLWIGLMLMALGSMRLWLTLKSAAGRLGGGSDNGDAR